jgi:hypothetical protein
MFVGVLLVIFALIGGLVLLVVGGDGDDESGGGANSAQAKKLQEEVLQRTVVNPDLGILVREPESWEHSKRRGAITLSSPDRCVAMTLSAPTPADDANKLFDDAVSFLRSSSNNAKIAPGDVGDIGGIPTKSSAVAYRNDQGELIQIIAAVGTGEEHAYLTEVVFGNPTCQAAVQRAQVVLLSIQYTK